MALAISAAETHAQENALIANFLPNYDGANTLSLVVFGAPNTVGTIRNLGGFDQSFTIDSTGVFQTSIARSSAELPTDGLVGNNALVINANNAISGIALNRENFTSDQSALLDVKALGKEYYALGYNGVFGGSQVSITAVEDNTKVTITSPSALLNGPAANTPYTLTLNAGQSVAFETAVGGDVSGAHILADRNIAVFGGSQCTQVPVGVVACDHVFDQNLSVDKYDTEYRIAENFGGGADADLIRVVASKDNTEVFLNGVSQGTINAGQFLEIDHVSNATLTASQPVQVGQYVRGQGGTRTTGDPAFAVVPSVNQWLKSYVYATPIGTEAFGQNFLNVAIAESSASTLILNGGSVDSSGFILLDGYLFGNILIDPGFGTISADIPFLAMIAGFNDFDSYFSAIATTFSSGASPPPEPPPEPPSGLRDITEANDQDTQLGVSLYRVFDGGTLHATMDQTDGFLIKDAGGSVLVDPGTAVTYSGVLADFPGQSGGLTLLGGGMLTLAALNTYTGATIISDGTLKLANGSGVAGNVLNNDVFLTEGTVSIGGSVINSAAMTSDGTTNIAGSLINTGSASFAGITNIGGDVTNNGTTTFSGTTGIAGSVFNNQTLAFNGMANIGGGAINNGLLAVNGVATVGGNLFNNGVVNLAAGGPGNVLTVNGNYGSMGGSLNVSTVVSGSGGTSDKLVIGGDVVSGPTKVNVDLTGIGGLTGTGVGQGIAVVDVSATKNTAAGDFALASGPIQNNVFLYNLNPQADGVYYLQSGYLPTIPGYEVYPSVLLNVTRMDRLRDRVADRVVAGWTDPVATVAGVGPTKAPVAAAGPAWSHPQMWMKADGARFKEGTNDSTTGASFDQDIWRVQGGVDVPFGDFANGSLVGGVNLQYINSSADVSSPYGSSTLSTDSFGGGLTLTWYGDTGYYVDLQGLYLGHSTDGVMPFDSNDAASGGVSAEMGKRFDLSPEWSVTPQVQFTYATVDFDSFTGAYGEYVSLEDGDSLTARIGFTVDRKWLTDKGPSSFFVSANVISEALRTTGVEVTTGPNSYGFEREAPNAAGELGLGGQIALGTTSYVGGAVYVAQGFNSSSDTDVRGHVVLSYRW